MVIIMVIVVIIMVIMVDLEVERHQPDHARVGGALLLEAYQQRLQQKGRGENEGVLRPFCR